MNALADVNPKNKPYIRAMRAANQPLCYGQYGLTQGPDNRAARRSTARWARSAKGRAAIATARNQKAKKFTMRPGDHTPKPKRSFWTKVVSFFKGGRA